MFKGFITQDSASNILHIDGQGVYQDSPLFIYSRDPFNTCLLSNYYVISTDLQDSDSLWRSDTSRRTLGSFGKKQDQ